jgi:hypothetical protein
MTPLQFRLLFSLAVANENNIGIIVTAQPVGVFGLFFVLFRRIRGEITRKITQKPAYLSSYE